MITAGKVLSAAITGRYQYPGEDKIDAKLLPIVALDFGSAASPDSPNTKMAELIRQMTAGAARPVFAQSEIYWLLCGQPLDGELQELPSAGSRFSARQAKDGRRGDTYEVLQDMTKYLPPGSEIILFAHACHILRAAKQAEKLGFKVYLPPHLPHSFSASEPLVWARYRPLWTVREILGQIWLRIIGRL